MSDSQPPQELPSQQPDEPKPSSELEKLHSDATPPGFDWRLVGVIGVVLLLVIAIYVNNRYYSNKAPTGQETAPEQGTAAPGQPAAPAKEMSDAEKYDRLCAEMEMTAAETVFSSRDRLLIMAAPPSPIGDPQNPQKIVGIAPGYMFDISDRLEDVKPEMFFRRYFFVNNAPVYRDTYPALGANPAIQMAIKPANAADSDARVSEAEIGDGDSVIGVVIDTDARAYPVKMANWHEVINDSLAGKDYVISWTALSSAAIALERPKIKDQIVVFGSAGFFYQGANVLYDGTTESLWQPIQARCLAGPSFGMRLVPIQTMLTSWKKWKALHPQTTALVGTLPNLGISYDHNPAVPSGNYLTSRSMAGVYPIVGLDIAKQYLRFKEPVFGVTGGDGKTFKAYVVRRLIDMSGPFDDTIAGQKVTISFDKDSRAFSAKTADGKTLLAQLMLWMAWEGAHPDTEVWQEAQLREEFEKQKAVAAAAAAPQEVKAIVGSGALPPPSKPKP